MWTFVLASSGKLNAISECGILHVNKVDKVGDNHNIASYHLHRVDHFTKCICLPVILTAQACMTLPVPLIQIL